MDNNKLPKRERLSGRNRIGTLFSDGSDAFVYPFKCLFRISDAAAGGDGVEDGAQSGGVSVLVSVPKKNHKRAVRRNKIRRRTREAFRLGKGGLSDKARNAGKQIDLALIYVSKEVEEYKTIENAVGKLLAKIAENI